jgi:hypothetical protein
MLWITTEFLGCCCQGTTEGFIASIYMTQLNLTADSKLVSTFPHPASPAKLRSCHSQSAPCPSSGTMRKRYPSGCHILPLTNQVSGQSFFPVTLH